MPENPIILDIQGNDGFELEFEESEDLDFETQPYSKGDPGKSAYQVAVDNGFSGTEEEWLASLVGPEGPPGTTDWDGITNKPTIPADLWEQGVDSNDNPVLGAIRPKGFTEGGIDYTNTASGLGAFAVGVHNTASGLGAVAFGNVSVASGVCSYAHGGGHLTASGQYSHAEGYKDNIASGNASHVEGRQNTASGNYAHAEGKESVASGRYAHAEGLGTIAETQASHSSGRYNTHDPTYTASDAYGTYAEIVGNGIDAQNRSNARTLDWSGNEVLAGKLTVGAGPTANMDVATKQYVDNATSNIPTKTSDLTNDSGFITSESDPVFTASAAHGITSTDITNWNNKSDFSGDYDDLTDKPTIPSKTSDLTNDSGFITSESDPVFAASAAHGISSSDISAWNAKSDFSGSYNDLTDKPTKLSDFADDLGSSPTHTHSQYLTSYTETDPVFTASVAHGITSTDVTNWNNKGTYSKPSGGIPKTDLASAVQASLGKADTALQSYTETDPVFTASAAHGITSSDITAWNNKSDFSGSYNDLTDVPASFTPSAHSHNLADVTDVTASASEVNILDGATIPTADLNQAYQGIPYGNVTSNSTTVFTATVPGVTTLKDGTCCLIRNNNKQTSASGWTLNVNDLGAKPVYNNMADASRETTIFNKVYTMLFVYDEDRVDGGCWICYKGYDSNTNTIGYQLRTNSTVMNVSDTARYYKLYFMSADNTKWVPASVNSTNNATSARPVNQRPINPFGRIVYTSANTNYTAGSNLAAATIWDQYALSLGYSFNRTGAALTMTVEAPVYVKCAPQADGSAIMDATTPIVQALPSTADGKIYIYLGVAYSAVNIELVPHHPVYYHDGTAIRLWTGASGLIPDWNEDDSTASDYILNRPNIRVGTDVDGSSVVMGVLDENTASGKYSIAAGRGNEASAGGAVTFGRNNKSTASFSLSSGYGNTASAQSTFATGDTCTASANAAFACGYHTTASGQCSHAEGYQTIANHAAQQVFGRYNIADPSANASTTYGDYVEIVGNGADAQNLSNARTLDWSGNEWLAGLVSVGASASPPTPTANNHLTTKKYVDDIVGDIETLLASI